MRTKKQIRASKREHQKRHYDKNKDRINERARIKRAWGSVEWKEAESKRRHANYMKNREDILREKQVYYQEHKEERQQYRKDNKEFINARRKANKKPLTKEQKKKVSKQNRKYYLANKDNRTEEQRLKANASRLRSYYRKKERETQAKEEELLKEKILKEKRDNELLLEKKNRLLEKQLTKQGEFSRERSKWINANTTLVGTPAYDDFINQLKSKLQIGA